jgi:hypothetical protein
MCCGLSQPREPPFPEATKSVAERSKTPHKPAKAQLKKLNEKPGKNGLA